MVNNKLMVCIYLVASMVIPCMVGNYKLKYKLTYAVGCECGL